MYWLCETMPCSRDASIVAAEYAVNALAASSSDVTRARMIPTPCGAGPGER